MKASITLSVLILAIGSYCGWRQSEHLDVIRETHCQVAIELHALGLSPETIGTQGKRALRSKREREETTDRTAEAKAVAGELIDWKKSAEAGHTDKERIEELMDKLEGFTPSQIEAVIAKIRASGDLGEKARSHVAELSLLMLGRNHPQGALDLFIDSSDVVSMAGMGQHIISTSLDNWAKENPAGALEWLRQNGEKRPELMTDRTKSAIIYGAAKKDPNLALSWVGELKLGDKSLISSGLAGSVSTPEERTALLAALRDFKNDDGTLLKKTLGFMAAFIAGNDFEASQAWLSSVKLTDQEMKHFTEGLQYYATQGDTGHWINWMADKLPEDQLPQKVGKFVWEWAENDYRAAGEWIDGSPDGPAKEAAVNAYAKVLAPHQPDSAAQWALTLPEGKERDKLLRIVHAEWQKKDPAAAAEFARAQGLGT
jgi:hypothetical protein